ncbi:MAG TPA: DUF2961 domain-containing protein [Polyangiales bacterium]
MQPQLCFLATALGHVACRHRFQVMFTLADEMLRTLRLDGALRIHGTGTEDYFNDGWYEVRGRLDSANAWPSHGFPVYEDSDGRKRTAAYRWHVPDSVPFEESIRVELEHGDQNSGGADYCQRASAGASTCPCRFAPHLHRRHDGNGPTGTTC